VYRLCFYLQHVAFPHSTLTPKILILYHEDSSAKSGTNT